MPAMLIDAQLYPHIWDAIRAHASPELLFRLRLVNRASSVEATSALFRHVLVGRGASGLGLTSMRGGGCGLPVPHPPKGPGPLVFGDAPPFTYVRAVDFASINHQYEVINNSQLQYARRRGYSEAPPFALTVVDALRLPPAKGEEAFMDDVHFETKRHVTVVLYDPTAKEIEKDNIMNIDFCTENVDGVFVFRACPAAKSATMVRNFWTTGEVNNDADDGHRASDDHGDDDDPSSDGHGDGGGLGGISAAGNSLSIMATDTAEIHIGGTPADEMAHNTFVYNFLWCAAHRLHKRTTYVGLESVPIHILAKQFKRDPVEVAARAAEPEWPDYVAAAAIEAIRTMPLDSDWYEGDEVWVDIDDAVEVLTVDAFRARVGEEAFVMETFADLMEAA